MHISSTCTCCHCHQIDLTCEYLGKVFSSIAFSPACHAPTHRIDCSLITPTHLLSPPVMFQLPKYTLFTLSLSYFFSAKILNALLNNLPIKSIRFALFCSRRLKSTPQSVTTTFNNNNDPYIGHSWNL